MSAINPDSVRCNNDFKKIVTVGEVMTAAPFTIGAEQPLLSAREMMKQNAIRHLPVMRGGQLVGIISDRDIDFALRVDKTENLKVDDAFTSELYQVSPTEKLSLVSTEMATQRIGCALIVNERQQLLGIFTAVDACRVLGTVLAN